MSEIKERILALHRISEALEPSEAQRQQYANEVCDYAGTFIEDLKTAKTFVDQRETPGSLSLSGQKKSFGELLKLYTDEVVAKGIKPASGGHVGYIPGGGIYTAAIADYLADVTNEYSGIYYASPGGVAIENELID